MYEPGAWLLVADVIDTEPGRLVGPRFHASEMLGLLTSGEGFTLLDTSTPVLWARSLSGQQAAVPHRGATDPEPSGWWSPDGKRMVPNWVFGWEGTGPTTFVTLLAIDERPDVDTATGAWFGWHTASYRARVAVTEWGIVDIDIRRNEEHA